MVFFIFPMLKDLLTQFNWIENLAMQYKYVQRSFDMKHIKNTNVYTSEKIIGLFLMLKIVYTFQRSHLRFMI